MNPRDAADSGGTSSDAAASTDAKSPSADASSGSSDAGGDGGPVVMPTKPAFPLVVSATGRYLEDQNGVPFRIHGDTAWDASVSLTLAEWRTYLDDRRAKGFNTVLVSLTNPVSYFAGSNAPASKGANGALPFLKNTSGAAWNGDPQFANDRSAHKPAPGNFDADFSSPNPTYFAWIDSMLAEAEQRGIAVLLTAHYMGYDNGSQDGWYRTVANPANTQSVCFQYGQFLGARYKGFKNLIWEMGVDSLPPQGQETTIRFHKIMEGIKAAGDTHLWTGHWVHDYFSTDSPDFAADMDIEGVYTHGPYPALGPTYGMSRQGYLRSPALPTILLETTYEGEHDVKAHQVRSFMWGSHLSGAGVIFGNLPIWPFSSGWSGALQSPGSAQMAIMARFFNAVPWHQLVPSGLASMKTLVTGGAGTASTWVRGTGQTGGDDWVVAAATKDGKHLVAYVPHEHQGSVTIDMTALSGTASARWFDPGNGAWRAIGDVANAGAHAFTPPGTNSAAANDWVLHVARK